MSKHVNDRQETRPPVELVITEGRDKGKRFAFSDADTFILGRNGDCNYSLPDIYFSRHHLLLEINQSIVALRDLGSLNGTYVNKVKYGGRVDGVEPTDAPPSPRVFLKHGDRIRAGATAMDVIINVPIRCVRCGQNLDEAARARAVFIDGAYLCRDCQDQEAGKAQDAVDAHMNVAQRKRALEDPGAMVADLFQRMLNLRRAPGAPARDPGAPGIEGYSHLTLIGKGGFGAVYRAKRRDGTEVALKMMLQTHNPDERALRLFQREVRLHRQLQHPRIVSVTADGRCGDIRYFEMEYLPDGSLADLVVRRGGQLALKEARQIMLDAAAGLAYAHAATVTEETKEGTKTIKGVVHRDLKPGNILLVKANNPPGWHARISDWGLAKAFCTAGLTADKITRDLEYAGTASYMAPEHITEYRYAKPHTDVFELAATFFHVLTGHGVWDIQKHEVPAEVILGSEPRRLSAYLPGAPAKLCAVFDRALAKDPTRRYPDGGALLNALQQVLVDV